MLRAHNPKCRLIAGVSEAFDDIEGGTEELIRLALQGHMFNASQPSIPEVHERPNHYSSFRTKG